MNKKIFEKSICLITVWVFLLSQVSYASFLYDGTFGLSSSSGENMPTYDENGSGWRDSKVEPLYEPEEQQIELTLPPSDAEEEDSPPTDIWGWLARNVIEPVANFFSDESTQSTAKTVLETGTNIVVGVAGALLFTACKAPPQAAPVSTPASTPLPLTPTTTLIPATPTPPPEVKIEQIIAEGANYLKQGSYEDAVKTFKKALELNPNSIDAHIGLVETYLITGANEDVKAQAQKVIQIEPNNAKPYYYLGVVYTKEKKHNESIEVFKKALELDSNYMVAYVELANSYANVGKFVEARDLLSKAIQIQPNNASLHYSMGVIYSRAGRINDDVTLAAYKKAVAIDPNHIDARYRLATIYFNRGNYPEAEPELLKVIELQPQHDRAHFFLAYIYKSQGKDDAAIAEYKKTLAMNPDPQLTATTLNNLADIYLKKGLLAEAKSTIEEAVRKDPNLGVAYVTLAEIYEKQGRYLEALDALKKLENLSIQLSPRIREEADKLKERLMKGGK